MQLTYADTAVERLCVTQELLTRAFGDLWVLVKACLSLLEVVETLADLTAFAAVIIQRTRQVSEDIAEYVIKLGGIQLTVRALSSLPSAGGPGCDRDDLAGVCAVSVTSVSQVSVAVARA